MDEMVTDKNKTQCGFLVLDGQMQPVEREGYSLASTIRYVMGIM